MSILKKNNRIHLFRFPNKYTVANAFLFLVLISFISCQQNQKSKEVNQFDPDLILNTIGGRLETAIQNSDNMRLPRTIENGEVRFTSAKSWTSGFFPGMLWMMADFDSEMNWSEMAAKYTEELNEVQYVTDHHDLGFMLYNSYGKGYHKTKSESYFEVLKNGAASLATRYDSSIGMIKSWDRPGKWQYPVIIDNMMNLEYFFWMATASGDSSYYEMAYSHALKSMNDHYRSDRSSYHVIDYDTVTSEVIWKGTHQGLNDESIWSRGQAWGLYGFTMTFRETGDSVFLDHAKKIAAYLMNHPQMPDDKVPYWDLKDPEIPNAPRDVSAAAIIASALLELSEYDEEKKDDYVQYATDILVNLNSDYRYQPSSKENFFYLDQSVGNMPKNKEVSVPIIYADYYFIEALIRLKEISG